MNKDQRFLQDIQECIARIDLYLDADTKPTAMAVDAIKYQLVVLGEAVGRLSQDIRDKAPDIPWTNIRSQRNLLVHEYAAIDSHQLLALREHHLAILSAAVADLLAEPRG